MKTLLAVVAAGSLALGLAGCGNNGGAGESGGSGDRALVGISMPTRSLERWNNDGKNLEKLLQDKGYDTDLQYADDKPDKQISQIQNMIASGANVLVVASIDGTALAPVLQEAADGGIPVIAYDRLINQTPNVDYYATFDNYKVGKMQGEYIEDQLDLKNGGGPYNFEPFAGSPDDNNARFFFQGAWDVLEPYVASGQLKIRSGKQPSVDSLGILGWKTPEAQSEMENRLQTFYNNGEKVDVVLSPNDSLALGIEQALVGAGYAPGDGWPVITGQDADQANVKAILDGQQAMTVWKDTRELGKRVAVMVDQIVDGKEVEVNDTETYDNGDHIVPSYLLDPVVVTKDGVEEILVGSGFYTKEDLGL